MKVDMNFNVKTAYCISEDERLKNVEYSSKKISGRLEPSIIKDNSEVAVVCFGPSLIETWEQIKKFKYIISCSGAHKFLIEKGIIPTWHVEVDPREHKVLLLGKPHKDVEYLISSNVHPKLIDILDGYKTKLWNSLPDVPLQKLPNHVPRGEWIFPGGSTVGIRSVCIASFLGFKKIHVFGMDSSYPKDNIGEHANFHPNPAKPSQKITVDYDGITYNTTLSFLAYAKEFFKLRKLIHDCELLFYGDGLLQHMIQGNWKSEEEKTEPGILAVYIPKLISDYYIEQNKTLHETNISYGTSGHRRSQEVLDLVKKYDTYDVLDYGCGKGTLAKILPFKIKEYDPAIKGKDETPLIADIVICTDVLEHIEPNYIDSVLGELQRLIKKVGFFVINTGPAIKQLPDGRNTHLIQQSRVWWHKKLEKYFEIDELIEKEPELFVYVKPKNENANDIPNTLGNKLAFQYIENSGIKFNVVNGYTQSRVDTLLTKEPITIEWINSFSETDIFFDIGANVGTYTLWAAKRGLKIFAFEPESQNYAILNQNIFLNNFDNVKSYCCAISDKFSIADFNITEFTPGSSCHQYNTTSDFNGKKGIFEYKQGCFSVTLDMLVETGMIPYPDHIKIDVDGLEHLVIKGAQNVLKKVSSLLIEININRNGHKEMIDYLLSIGFQYDKNQVEKSIRKTGIFKDIGEYVFYRK